jgi:hypothetical protein
MIRYALSCDKGHEFESWFRDSASYDEQLAHGLVTCAYCGSALVEKQIMSPNVARTDLPAPASTETDTPGPAAGLPVPAEPAPTPAMALLGEREQAFRAMLRAVRQHVMENAEHVGPRFADEARRMHDGLTEFRAIYGEATPEEAAALAEEGIEALPLPWLPDERN